MRGMNRVMLIGNVGRDFELRESKGGQPWGTMSLATGRSKRDGDLWVEETDWHTVKVFGTNAERCHKLVRKGALVAVEGTIHYEKWTGQDGIGRTAARVLADRVTFLNLGDRPPADVSEGAEGGQEPAIA